MIGHLSQCVPCLASLDEACSLVGVSPEILQILIYHMPVLSLQTPSKDKNSAIWAQLMFV